ncbi:HlyD family type I secretion membrane fusion protein [Tahibacter aquaticus]|uniref:Membrane fusion protein (MFP) family protein n=1 Tax=Tahibacter aquaticus TaxID=520092 RepID=A0A4V3DMZ4_9GAMM|nr:HlyD family type I secretion periplasmic adaptor subunit [Tahibacter aquaticus]TDR46476.1 HlyD family type I secretion membrane fusion protein [Tahibacter aquaticus]
MKHTLLAIKDMLSRYGAIVRSAWTGRHTLQRPPLSGDERAFLPAHLELIETPTSPAARWFMRIVMAFFCVALLWACLGKLDIVAVAPGKIVVGSRTKVIQPAESAVVKQILVRDGQTVKRGDLLIELDATGTGADYAKAGEALINARLAELRHTAMADALDHGRAPVLAPDPELPQALHASEQRLVRSEHEAYRARNESLVAAIAQRRAELQTTQGSIASLEESAKIARLRVADYAQLLERKVVSRHDYLLREQERISAERDLAVQRDRISELKSALDGAQEQQRVLAAEMRQQTLDGLRQAREQVAQLAPEVSKTGQRNQLMQLRAPVDGTVQQLAIHTVGGVVTPAQPLLAIVPSDDALEVEATVLNKDIGFIRTGQHVAVKVESFPYTRFGYLEGTVESISHDAAQDERLGAVFPARVRLKNAHLNIDGVRVAMTPGMSLSVEIMTGQRRVISYLLSPIQKGLSESAREQ